MNIDMRCLCAALVLIITVGVSAALPLDLYGPAQDEDDLVKRYPDPNPWLGALYEDELPPRDARGRKNWRSSSPYGMVSLVDDSVTRYDSQTMYCSMNQVCKQGEKKSFKCRCPSLTSCVAAGRRFDATCQYSKVGVVYKQRPWH